MAWVCSRLSPSAGLLDFSISKKPTDTDAFIRHNGNVVRSGTRLGSGAEKTIPGAPSPMFPVAAWRPLFCIPVSGIRYPWRRGALPDKPPAPLRMSRDPREPGRFTPLQLAPILTNWNRGITAPLACVIKSGVTQTVGILYRDHCQHLKVFYSIIL